MKSQYIAYVMKYKGFTGHDAHCKVMLWTRDDGVSHILLIEAQDNTGASVTNMSEYLATTIVTKFKLNPHQCYWYETYEEDRGKLRIDEITYGSFDNRYHTPHWSPLSTDIFKGTIFIEHGFEFSFPAQLFTNNRMLDVNQTANS